MKTYYRIVKDNVIVGAYPSYQQARSILLAYSRNKDNKWHDLKVVDMNGNTCYGIFIAR